MSDEKTRSCVSPEARAPCNEVSVTATSPIEHVALILQDNHTYGRLPISTRA